MASWKTMATSGDKLSIFSATTSAELRGVLSDESGTGVAIFAGGNIGDADATTQTSGNNTTKIATTAFVNNAVSGENTIAEMNDVNLSTPADGGMLLFDTANDEWIDNVMSGDATMADTGVITFTDHGNTRSNLGLGIGQDVQAQDPVLEDLSALAVIADNEVIVGTGAGTYANQSGDTLRTSLGLAIGTDVQAFDATYVVDADIGSTVQAQDAVLDDLSALAVIADNEMIVGTGAGTYANQNGSTLRTSIGVGTGDSPVFTDLTLSGGDLTYTSNFAIAGQEVTSGTGHRATIGGGNAKTGNTNVNAGALILAGGKGTGSGAGGDIVFEVANASLSGTSQNALATALTISDDKSASFTGAVTIAGNLTVSGTTITTLSEEVKFEDNILILNSNATGATASEDAGWEVERGDRTNTSISYDESAHEWVARSQMSSTNDTTAEVGRLAVIERAGSGTGGSSTAVGSMFINTATEVMYIYM